MTRKITTLTLLAFAAVTTTQAAMRKYDSTIHWRESLCAACELNEFLLTNGFHAFETDTGVVNARNSDKRTPLHEAARIGNADIAALLLAHGADFHARGKLFDMPLHEAACHGHAEVAIVLLARGADVNAKSCWGRTPLHDAAFNGSAEVALLLIARGADVNARDKQGRTPFDIAISNGRTKCAELLRAAQEAINKDQRPC